jgi:hypothetical protein
MKWKWLLHTVVYLGCLIALLWQSYRIRDLQDQHLLCHNSLMLQRTAGNS